MQKLFNLNKFDYVNIFMVLCICLDFEKDLYMYVNIFIIYLKERIRYLNKLRFFLIFVNEYKLEI